MIAFLARQHSSLPDQQIHSPWCRKLGSVMNRIPSTSRMHVAFPTHKSFPPNGVVTGFSCDLVYPPSGESGKEASKQGSRTSGKISVGVDMVVEIEKRRVIWVVGSEWDGETGERRP